jgi:hypothetical protein
MFRLHLQWMPAATASFRTGVSLHSHTLYSRENLDFIYQAVIKVPLLGAALRHGEQRYRRIHNQTLDLGRGWWTPPLGAHEAWCVEKTQIEGLDLTPMVSLTDHDNIEAPVSLQLLEECRGTPISLEWTVPFQQTFFHIGVHNLPPSRARAIFDELQRHTVQPDNRLLRELMAALASIPDVLVVFNHPFWDEKGIGSAAHEETVRQFLRLFRPHVHALELNGLRPWRENRKIISLARELGKPAVAGGDRHALEANALINLTHAATFQEFVDEVRGGWSDILILRHYRESHASRILHNTIDVLRTYDRHANGWRLWSDRVFYRGDDRVRSLTELFGETPSAAVTVLVKTLQLVSAPKVLRLLRGAVFPAEEVVL